MKLLVLISLVAFLSCSVQAQYRTYKHQYDVNEYIAQPDDRYSLGTVTFLSVLAPGLGHISMHQPWRGLGFYILTRGSFAATMIGFSQLNGINDRTTAIALFSGGATLCVSSYIWCISDARKMAKIKNMRIRDQKLAFHLYPSLQLTPNENLRFSNAPALTMAVNF
ncbi:MAG: hypothetical protein ACM3P1_12790 [Candidatus Saccharibacteria bacterium]